MTTFKVHAGWWTFFGRPLPGPPALFYAVPAPDADASLVAAFDRAMARLNASA